MSTSSSPGSLPVRSRSTSRHSATARRARGAPSSSRTRTAITSSLKGRGLKTQRRRGAALGYTLTNWRGQDGAVSLAGKTLFITGASRGIGLAIALRAARDGANIAIAAKTTEPHPKLPGTIYSAAQQIEQAGGRALPLVVDVRDEASASAAVAQCAQTFGGIDICVNNASAINLAPTAQIDMRRYDLIQQVNTRGTFVTSRACLQYLKKAANPHILSLAPPLDLKAKWFAGHLAYSLSKYGMSLCMLGRS